MKGRVHSGNEEPLRLGTTRVEADYTPSCLGCGRVGTPTIWHEATGVYLCERCAVAVRSTPASDTPTLRGAMERVLRGASRGGLGWGFNADMHEKEVVEAILSDAAVRAALASTPEPVRPGVTWHGADRRAVVLMAPIGEDGLCEGCGTKPSRETGSCRCLFRVDAAIRALRPTQEEVR